MRALEESIQAVREAFQTDLKKLSSHPEEAPSLQTKYFGRKGRLADLFHQLKEVDPVAKPALGKELNILKRSLMETFHQAVDSLAGTESVAAQPDLDPSLPGYPFPAGSLHPLQQIQDEIKAIFTSIGFAVAYGPEIDDDYHNFQALNMPKHHPARDMQDTFFITENTLLRTHTSNVQVHLMENQSPPLRYIVPGRVYRHEAISFKSFCLFHQVEGLYVDRRVSFGDLKGTLEYFVKRLFGPQVKTRFRPSFFPFTEPSAELDIWSPARGQWLEVLGCGMVDPAVFQQVGYDPDLWHGFAFGMGFDRIAMLKYQIDDIRLFFQGDVRFLEQF